MTQRPQPSVPPGDASASQSAPMPSMPTPATPSLSDLKQQIVLELLVLHRCYTRLNQDAGEPHRFMSFVHSLFALLPPELQLTESEVLAVDELVSPNASPYNPVASRSFLDNLPTVDTSGCPELSTEDCPVCQEPFTVEPSLTTPITSSSSSSHHIDLTQNDGQWVSLTNDRDSVDTRPATAAPRIIELPCEHIFHFPCVAAWMAKHNTCPCCRFKLPTDNPLYNETVIRQQPDPVRRNRRAKRRACDMSRPSSPPPAKRASCARPSRCALSTHGLPCLLPVRHQMDSSSSEPLPDTVEHLSCGHSFHAHCLHTALTLLGVATMQPDIGPCPLCCLHTASPESTARLQRMTLPLISIQPSPSRPTSPVQYRISPSPAVRHPERYFQ